MTLEGLIDIVSIKATINLGLSEELEIAFSSSDRLKKLTKIEIATFLIVSIFLYSYFFITITYIYIFVW